MIEVCDGFLEKTILFRAFLEKIVKIDFKEINN
jgi:hypothetical protein